MRKLKTVLSGVIMLLVSSFAVAQTTYKIESAWGGKVLDVTGGSTDDGAVVQQWQYNGAPWQQWTLEDQGNGTVIIRNSWSGKVLDLANGFTENGATLQQWEADGSPWQQWTLEDAGGGAVTIRNVWSGKVLDVTSGSTDNGAIIQQWDSTGSPWQQWRIVSASGNTPPVPSISIEGRNYGDEVLTGSTVTVHYAATDVDGNLAGIRYNIWNATTGYFDNGNGFVAQSGGSGDVVKTFTLSTEGEWYVWTDVQDATGSYVSTGDWSRGFKVVVSSSANHTPVPTISVDGRSYGSTVPLNTTITVHYAATDIDGNFSGIRYNIWNATTGYFDNGGGGFASQPGNGGDLVKTFVLSTPGEWYVWTDAQDTLGAYASTGHWTSGFRITVQNGIQYLPVSGYERAYEPWSWNDGGTIQYTTNCYAYAINLQHDPKTGESFPLARGHGYCLQPGELASYWINWDTALNDPSSGEIQYASTLDASYTGGTFQEVGRYNECPANTYKVALVLAIGWDYHWYRQNPDGTWSHKRGQTAVKNVDESGSTIYDPQTADRDAYTTFLGYYAVSDTGGGPGTAAYATTSNQAAVQRQVAAQSAAVQTNLTVSNFSSLRVGMSLAEVVAQVGSSSKTVGGGMIIYQYELQDGSKVLLNFGPSGASLWKAKVIYASGGSAIFLQ